MKKIVLATVLVAATAGYAAADSDIVENEKSGLKAVLRAGASDADLQALVADASSS